MEPILSVKLGDESLSAAHITVQEMLKVKTWTELKTRREFFGAVLAEDPQALIAAYLLAKGRSGGPVPRFDDADFDLDTLDVSLTDPEGREVEPVVERDENDEPKLDDNGQPIPVLDAKGAQKWVYADSGDPVPPTGTDSTTT